MKNTPGSSACSALPPPSLDCILTLLPQQPSAEDAHVHAQTHSHAQTHIYKHPTCSSYKAGLYSVRRVSALNVFAPVCASAHAGISSLERVKNHRPIPPSPSIFFSSSLTVLLFPPCPLWPVKHKHNLSSTSRPTPHTNVRRRSSSCVRNFQVRVIRR